LAEAGYIAEGVDDEADDDTVESPDNVFQQVCYDYQQACLHTKLRALQARRNSDPVLRKLPTDAVRGLCAHVAERALHAVARQAEVTHPMAQRLWDDQAEVLAAWQAHAESFVASAED